MIVSKGVFTEKTIKVGPPLAVMVRLSLDLERASGSSVLLRTRSSLSHTLVTSDCQSPIKNESGHTISVPFCFSAAIALNA